ncbi:MAG: transcriptional repressor [Planctomycetaceae bacterium]|nr:transcriptional repressor [Planctomycetaceae bacterium]
MSNSQVSDLLRQAGLRLTAPRERILQSLLEAGAPLTQEQIAERLGASAPNKTTIYRTLMSLAGKGLVHRAYLGERTWHFEPAHHCSQHQCHPHFTCTRCRKTRCMTQVKAPLLALPKGYRLERQSIRIEGVCSACTARK